MTTHHEDHHYSITIKTSDETLLNAIRGICQFAQLTGNPRIAWGGTGVAEWRKDNYSVTFHFSKIEYRNIFIKESTRLLPKDLWEIMCTKDNDPAIPQAENKKRQ